MQLTTNNKFDQKKVEGFLRTENKFITDVFSFTLIPERHEQLESDEENDSSDIKTFIPNGKKTSRAKSLEELQQRLHAITSKKKLTYKEKLLKKGIKNRMKKKNLNGERKNMKKLERAAKLEQEVKNETVEETKIEMNQDKLTSQPVFNKEDKMVFSRFNFENLGVNKKIKKKNPKQILEKIVQDQEKLEKLKETGDIEKVIEIKEKTAWKNALAKASGEKVKDDPLLLKKSLKKQEQKHKSSKKKWEKRVQGVENAKEEKQKKRQENIAKRKKEKKTNKLKKAAKRGKIIPGF